MIVSSAGQCPNDQAPEEDGYIVRGGEDTQLLDIINNKWAVARVTSRAPSLQNNRIQQWSERNQPIMRLELWLQGHGGNIFLTVSDCIYNFWSDANKNPFAYVNI